VDRKFHVGMQTFAKGIAAPLLTVHPESAADTLTMDLIEVPIAELPYRVMTVRTGARGGMPVEEDQARLQKEIAASRLVYGAHLGAAGFARNSGVPYIAVLEYDLRTELVVTTSQVSSLLRQGVRAARRTVSYAKEALSDFTRAHSIHCNGYPVYDESGLFNANRLLYLDSRMSADMVISAEQLQQRLATRSTRPLRLLFSGRYEHLKGTDDAVEVVIECLRRGLDVEMHFYGQGSLKSAMQARAAQAAVPGRIHIHDAIPYPELVEKSRDFDIFVCCHRQSDPSCTYLESMGAGLPIVGYDNRMWKRLAADSGAGLASKMGQPGLVADDVERLAKDTALLDAMSGRARHFAVEHTFEREFDLRMRSLNDTLEKLPANGMRTRSGT
jgi:glycosyltransferase involved in cell wall biosynthesis